MGRTASKNLMHCKCGKEVPIEPMVVYCPDCHKPMEEEGYRFFDHLKIINLHPSERAECEDTESERISPYYVFNLSVGGIIINGCTYNPLRGAVLMPRGLPRRSRMVKLFGATAKRIRSMLDKEIKATKQLPINESEAIAA